MIGFTMPWALLSLFSLPFLWYLMHTRRPRARFVRFPAIRLLLELPQHEATPKTAPWYHVLIRLLGISALFIALAGPYWQAPNTPSTSIQKQPVLIILQNDWQAFGQWEGQQAAVRKTLERLTQENRLALIIPTLQTKNIPQEFTAASPWQSFSTKIVPHASSMDWDDFQKRLKNALALSSSPIDVLWIGPRTQRQDQDLRAILADQTVFYDYSDPALSTPKAVLHAVERHQDGYEIRYSAAPQTPLSISLRDEKNQALWSAPLPMIEDLQSKAVINVPPALRPQARSLLLGNHPHPAAQHHLTDQWRDQHILLLAPNNQGQTLTDPAYYLKTALAPYVQVSRNNSVPNDFSPYHIIMDSAQRPLSARDEQRLAQWVQAGGTFIRFGHSHFQPDRLNSPLNVTPLRPHLRYFSGSLSWEKTGLLAPFPADGPFYTLETSDKVNVQQHQLPRAPLPPDVAIWARLQDNSPLITARRSGQGQLVQFYIAPLADWSNLIYAGTFESLLIRTLQQAHRPQDGMQNDRPLVPHAFFTPQGSLAPLSTTLSIPSLRIPDLTTKMPSQDTPAGLYAQGSVQYYYSLGAFTVLPNSAPTALPWQTAQLAVLFLQGWFLMIAFICLVLDSLFSNHRLRRSSVVILLALYATPLSAADPTPLSAKTYEALSQMRLAYVESGQPPIDHAVNRGLLGLSRVMRQRTSVHLAAPHTFDPNQEDPSLYPLIYWPLPEPLADLSIPAQKRLKSYLQNGGMIIFDTLGKARPQAISSLTNQLSLSTLAPIDTDHILTRTFYLLSQFPGQYDHPKLWAEQNNNSNLDGVSSVLIGQNSWAYAWARDDNNKPLYPVIPNGEDQREYAYRSGINMVLYALSGHYKGDQVHMPAILQRLGL